MSEFDNVTLITNGLNEKEKYVIGATALDCSMMLTFQRVLLSSSNW